MKRIWANVELLAAAVLDLPVKNDNSPK